MTAQSALLFVFHSEENPQIAKMMLTFVCLGGTKSSRGIARIQAVRNSTSRGNGDRCTFVPDSWLALHRGKLHVCGMSILASFREPFLHIRYGTVGPPVRTAHVLSQKIRTCALRTRGLTVYRIGYAKMVP